MADERLRRELKALGYSPGPITDSTRGVLEKKLQRLKRETGLKRRGHKSRLRDDDDDEEEEEEEAAEEEQGGSWEQKRSWPTGDVWDPRRAGIDRGSHGVERNVSPVGEGIGLWSKGSSLGGEEWGTHRKSPLEDKVEVNSFPQRRMVAHEVHNSAPRRETYLAEEGWAKQRNVGEVGRDLWGTLGQTTRGNSLSFTQDSSSPQLSLPINRDPLRSRSLYGQEERVPPKIWPHGERDCSNFGPLRQERSGPRASWQKSWALEYYLSRLLWGLSVLLFIFFIGILTVKSGILSTEQESNLKQLPSDCKGRTDPFCKAKHKKITLEILSELYEFLSLEAGRFDCGNPAGLSSKCIPISTAMEHVTNVSGHPPDKFDAALEWVLSSDEHLGIWVRGEDPAGTVTSRHGASCVESSRPRLGIGCRVKNAFYIALTNLFLAVLGLLLLWLVLVILRYHWRCLEEEEKMMYGMVERIIDLVRNHYKDYRLAKAQHPFLGIVHVRDSIIPPQDRKRLRKVWDRAVQFLESNESRIRTESQRVAGEDLTVWRWTQSRGELI
ncbi:LEM domain-containing protein 2 [Ascaphus truei]|uniref:LEM domain-containing protein 2 n=1 Tax=Ascaphus truei TaxID=8439 RepID=UPI003F5A0CAC